VDSLWTLSKKPENKNKSQKSYIRKLGRDSLLEKGIRFLRGQQSSEKFLLKKLRNYKLE
jgi:hypothetical protein